MYIVGFDGLVRAGKSTLLKNNLGPALNAPIIDEYGVYTKGSTSFPPFPPPSHEKALAASQFFIDIEKQRINDLGAYETHDIVLVDRTYLSCLGFDYAARHITGFDTFSEVKQFWAQTQKIEPQLIIFLDVSHDSLEERIGPHKSKFLPHFYDRTFNGHMSEFFHRTCKENPLFIRVDADQTPNQVFMTVLDIIQAQCC